MIEICSYITVCCCVISVIALWWLGRRLEDVLRERRLVSEFSPYRRGTSDWPALLSVNPYSNTSTARSLTELRNSSLRVIVLSLWLEVFGVFNLCLTLVLVNVMTVSSVAQIVSYGIMLTLIPFEVVRLRRLFSRATQLRRVPKKSEEA